MTKYDEDDEINLKTTNEQIRERVVFVGDRITMAISFFFVILIAFSWFSYIAEFDTIFSLSPSLFLIFLLNILISWLFYILINEEFYFSKRLFLNPNFILMLNIWISIAIILSSFFAIIYSWVHIIEVSVFYVIVYILGYVGARLMWKPWNSFSKNSKYIAVLGTIVLVIISSVIVANIFNLLENSKLEIYTYLFGFGLLGSIGL